MTTALTNAVGVSLGAALFLFLVQLQGEEFILGLFPDLQGDGWPRIKEIVHDWGLIGSILVAALPIVIHPLLLFGLVAGIERLPLITAVMLGRTIKYGVMSWCALQAPGFLKYFGVSRVALDRITNSMADHSHAKLAGDSQEPNGRIISTPEKISDAPRRPVTRSSAKRQSVTEFGSRE